MIRGKTRISPNESGERGCVISESPESGSEIYVGSGNLSFAGNRKVADLVWNTPPALNNFTLTYTPALPPALARITMIASGSTSAGPVL